MGSQLNKSFRFLLTRFSWSLFHLCFDHFYFINLFLYFYPKICYFWINDCSRPSKGINDITFNIKFPFLPKKIILLSLQSPRISLLSASEWRLSNKMTDKGINKLPTSYNLKFLIWRLILDDFRFWFFYFISHQEVGLGGANTQHILQFILSIYKTSLHLDNDTPK